MEFEDMGFIDKIKTFNYNDLKIFLIPFIIFSIYLAVFNPCIATIDSFNQLNQIASGHFTNWHPFFHTFIEMLCLKVYPSTISICIFQILVFSSMWTIICKYNRDDDIEMDNTFKMQVIFSVIICIIPINGLYSITLWKDILFSYFLMFLCFLIKVMIDKGGNVSYTFAIIISLIMAFIAQLRPNGIYIIAILLILLAIYLFRKNKAEKLFIAIPTLTVVFILLIASLNVVYDVEDYQRDALMAKTAHVLADYDLNLELSDADRDKIHELISEKDIKQFYNIRFSDAVFEHSNETVFSNNKATYIMMVLSYSLKNPIHFIEYFFNSSPLVWDITRGDDWVGTEFNLYIDNGKQRYYNYAHMQPVTDYDNATPKKAGTDEYNNMFGFVNTFKLNKALDSLFNSPALYMYLAILAMIGIHLITKSKSIYFAYLPNLLNILIIMFSISAQDTRFLYANLLVAYLMIIILINEYEKKKLNVEPVNSQPTTSNQSSSQIQDEQKLLEIEKFLEDENNLAEIKEIIEKERKMQEVQKQLEDEENLRKVKEYLKDNKKDE